MNPPRLVPAAIVRFSTTALCVAVARTAEEQERGLMDRDDLDGCDGMLFVFDEPDRYAFWMQGVRMPLDVTWLDRRRRIVALAENLLPCEAPPCPEYAPPAPARYVLEVPAGVLRDVGVRIGAVATIEWL